MKKFVAALLAALMLGSLTGCKEAALPTIEDTALYARKEANTLAAAQGEWMVMRAEKDGAPGLLLYNKEEKTGHFLLEGAYKNPGLLGNRVYYQTEDTGDLYCYDLATKEQKLLVSAAQQYQIRDGVLYYTLDRILYTRPLELGARKAVKTGYSVDRFWLTDYGVYYYTAEKQLLMVCPTGAENDLIVCRPEGAVLDVVATKGAHIAFIQKGSKGNTLCTYNPANKEVFARLEGKFSLLCMVKERAVVADGTSLYAVDLSTGEKEDWGGTAAESVQLLSDCAVFYTGNESAIRFYPE